MPWVAGCPEKPGVYDVRCTRTLDLVFDNGKTWTWPAGEVRFATFGPSKLVPAGSAASAMGLGALNIPHVGVVLLGKESPIEHRAVKVPSRPVD